MNSFLKKWRKENLSKASIGKYLLYAIGEILLITLGVLIAVNINDRATENKHQLLRCQYLEELHYTFDFDIKDVQGNISSFERWNPKIAEVITAIENKKLTKLDSATNRINTISRYIFFGQRSKTKMEELKYSDIDLIGNRSLKNKLLLYQDEQISFLLNMERRYDSVDEERRQYYSNNLFGTTVDMGKLEKDPYFLSIIRQKYSYSTNMNNIYQRVLKEQLAIKALIEEEIAKKCH